MGLRAVALWCALVVAASARASAYTVDCNHEYTDCDTELRKINDEDEGLAPKASLLDSTTTVTTTQPTTTTIALQENKTETNAPEVQNDVSKTFKELEDMKPKPRLLNINVDELQNFANAIHNQSEFKNAKKLEDLSDVNIDAEDEDEPTLPAVGKKKDIIPDKFYANLQAPFHPLMNVDRGDSEELEVCKENGISYKSGERLDRGCEETCECLPSGAFECSPRCKHPYIRRGRRLDDPLCFESPVDDCCSIVACSTSGTDIKLTKAGMCKYGNDSFPVGATWHIGCEQTCSCADNSVVTCKPRCDPLPISDKCINVQDPNDACCEVQVCDVSHDVHEEHENATSTTSTTTEQGAKGFEDYNEQLHEMHNFTEPIGSVKVLQNNSVQVNLIHLNNSQDPIHLLLSSDGGRTYDDVELKYSNLILNLDGGKDYILKTKETGTKFNFTVTASEINEVPNENLNVTKVGCYHDGVFYGVGEEFHIGCSSLCECTGADTRECAALVCPSHVGLELMSRGCVRWAPPPPAAPPACCPRAARCLSDGTCHYKGVPVPNWSEVPIALTGCEQRCFCENGELDCQEVCSPLPPVPPQHLRCPLNHRPAAVNISDEDCCKQWGCVPNGDISTDLPPPPPRQPFLPTIPPNIHFPLDEVPGYNDNKKLSVITLVADSPTSVKMLFGLPSVLVGLRGSVDLRYTDESDDDITHWYSQVFAPADEVLTTPRLEFRLSGLKPSTMYKIRGKLYLHNLPVEPESDIYTIRTLDLPIVAAPEEKSREIDALLTVVDVNDTAAHVSWRHFTEDELQYIDGVQVRYRPVGTPIYSMTELLHHSRTVAELFDLRPSSRYEASLVLVPPPRASTELTDPRVVEFNTKEFVDPYNWSIQIEARSVGAGAAELSWRGVPAPAERWVRVYRAAHACGHKKELDDFRLATRDLPPSITLTGLPADSKCRVWLELFLTNGKVKTSNVLEINTKSLDSAEPIDNSIESSSVREQHSGDYYGALVGVGVVAALGALSSLLLLLVVLRRHRPRSVAITAVPSAPRESSLPPYDNPAYKLELQQETMDL